MKFVKSALQKGEYVTAFDISAKLTENNASKEVTALDNPVSIIMRIPDNYKSKANKLMLVAADGSSVNVTLEDKYAVAKVNSLGSYALVAKKSSSTIPSGGGGGGAEAPGHAAGGPAAGVRPHPHGDGPGDGAAGEGGGQVVRPHQMSGGAEGRESGVPPGGGADRAGVG